MLLLAAVKSQGHGGFAQGSLDSIHDTLAMHIQQYPACTRWSAAKQSFCLMLTSGHPGMYHSSHYIAHMQIEGMTALWFTTIHDTVQVLPRVLA